MNDYTIGLDLNRALAATIQLRETVTALTCEQVDNAVADDIRAALENIQRIAREAAALMDFAVAKKGA